MSVLRRRMQSLADHLGSPLVDGRGAAMRLTKTGDHTRELSARALEAVDLITSRARPDDVGPLRIACTGTFLADVLPPVLATVRDRHRALRFGVRREGATSSRDLLARGDIDFAVVRSTSTPEGLASKRLGRDRLWLAMQKDSPLASAPRHVAAGLGIAFVSLLQGQEPSHPRVIVRDVTPHFAPVAFHLVWPRGRAPSGYRKTFADGLVSACA